jgi:uncharacterized membrane protein YuzA (DUF378 family)
MAKLTILDMVSLILVIVGGLNWGLVAISPDYDLVQLIFGAIPGLVMIVYGLVGLAAVYMAVIFPKLERK